MGLRGVPTCYDGYENKMRGTLNKLQNCML